MESIILGMIILLAIALSSIMMYRNNLIYRIRNRRIDEIINYRGKLLDSIEPSEINPNVVSNDLFIYNSYNKMMLNFKGWSYDYFYSSRPIEELDWFNTKLEKD
jgi:hypothetical protein